MERAGNEAMEVRLDWKAELAALEQFTTELYTAKGKEKAKGERKVVWEKFLPRRSLRVLLAEADDSTRQIVSALLCNCSYQVTAVGDGLLAWGLLEDPSNCFDLVLTEVAMTSLSGFNLLCKIMSHENLKHIPVISKTHLLKPSNVLSYVDFLFFIMKATAVLLSSKRRLHFFSLLHAVMSSLDSMSIVFKCLTKGAVDFLVKPVRKNELQNLWQHVWRRCHSSSCSGTGRQNQNAAQRKNEAGYDNNTDSIVGIENASGGLDIREGSDNGSGTQGSWTNQHEVEISYQRGKWKRHHGSKFAQATQMKNEKTQNNWMQSVKTYAKACGQDLVIAVPGRVPTHMECLREKSTFHDQSCQNQEVDCSASCGEGDHLGDESVKEGSEPKAIDLIGKMGSEPHCRNGDKEDSRSGEELELTLNRPRANWNEYSKLKDKCTLRQSDASAFSRYNVGDIHFSFPWGGSFPVNLYPKNKVQYYVSSENTGSLHLRVPFEQLGCSKRSSGDAPDQYQLSHSANNQDKGSSGQAACPSSVPMKDETPVSLPMGAAIPISPGSFPVNLYPKNKEQYCVSSENTGSLHLTVPFEQLGCSKRSSGYAPDQYQLLHSANNQDKGSSGQAACPSSVPMKDETPVSLPMGAAMPISPGIISFDGVPPPYGTSLHPMFYSYPGVPIWGSDTPLKAEREDARDNSSYHEPHCVPLHVPDHSRHYNHLHHHHIQYHHHHHHHHHHERHEHKKHARQDECAVDNAATTAQGGSYIMTRNTLSLGGNCGESGSSNGHGSNGDADRSASGSNNNGINVPTGKSTVAVIPGANGGSGTGNTSTTGSGVENNLSARREAALVKFQQKRKERCFEKKVRYQSRKTFAEQRPRVKGQFVRHLSINKSEAGEEK
ncbi:two-component response regulator-like PRR37 isoform X2 [Cryptomeria japonica]|uniref:two-component response regulator-like PRR37 isoform X2 n=1 Tax=Cryptomeria japonica TaxID=3369 RepID=UPI0027DA6252|nr:two-component response regulator-like PRR37 isoform X2 [Cryptomeria japonica]